MSYMRKIRKKLVDFKIFISVTPSVKSINNIRCLNKLLLFDQQEKKTFCIIFRISFILDEAYSDLDFEINIVEIR